MSTKDANASLKDLHLRAAQAGEVMDSLPCVVFVCHFTFMGAPPRYLFVSSGAKDLLGVDADTIMQHADARFRYVPDEDRQRIEQTIREAAVRDGIWNQEFRVVIADVERWVDAHARIHRLEDDSIIAHGFWTDITARKRLEQRRQESHDRFRQMFESAPQPIGISDGKGNITALNPAYTQSFGFTQQDAPTLEALFECHYPDPQYRAQVFREWTDVVERFHLTNRPEGPVVTRMRCKDGRFRTVEIRSAFAPHGEAIVMFNDISEQVAAAERMKLWSSVLDHSSEGIVICDAELRVMLVNAAFETMTGYSEQEVIGETPRMLRSGLQDEAFYREILATIAAHGQWHGELWSRRKNGEVYPEWLSINAVRDDHGTVTHYVGIFSDITARKESEERIRHLAQYDLLTALPNRALLTDRLAQLIASAKREQTRIGALYIDLDRFKEVNDSMGHEAGDLLLVALAKRLRAALRQSDTVARMGGDEFVVLLPLLREPDDAAVVARKLLEVIREPLMLKDNELTITATVGICIYPEDGADPGQLLRNSDAAMHEAKSAGRNAYRFYTQDLNARALDRLSLENALRRAVKQNELVLYYQPQIDIRSGEIFGAEALMRWNRPGVGLVPPGDFIPFAEERGLIASMGRWALGEAARQAAAWEKDGIVITVAVNLSAVQFHQKGFVEHVAEVIAAHGIAPSRIELELTESIIIRDANAAITLLERLHELGVFLSIDDFGTGYSSLNYLRRFPIDRIKIDKSFVDEIAKHAGTARVVSGIIGLAKGLGLKVVAEGVETEAQLELLRGQDCDEAQGYLFSRPIPAVDFEAFYRSWPRVRSSS
jgi:diguanylate cyclase (GGDEF)-like protein/PAS domain S-box-containing protein